MDTYLSVNKLNVFIKKRQILSNITFNVNAGEVVGLLGPNGSGKTTTIKTLAGLVKKSSGTVNSCGVDMNKDFEKYIRNIAFGFDKANYYPFQTGYDNLKFFTNAYKKCTKSDILNCVEQVGLSKRIYDKVSTYSYGMRQRLNFAKSILTSAKIIILDEPFNGIDPAGIVEMRELIHELQIKGTAFVVSSHLLNEIEDISNRLLFYKNGEILKNISVCDYVSYNHYINVDKPTALLNTSIFPKNIKVEIVENDMLKINCDSNKLSEALHILYENNFSVISVSSKRAIEDLYMRTVGGSQIE